MKQTYIGGRRREDFSELEELFKGVEAFMGYVPNAHLTMAEKPELLMAFSSLAMTIFQSEGIEMETKQLIALASSLSSGCKYCQAHTSHGAERAGTDEKKIAEISVEDLTNIVRMIVQEAMTNCTVTGEMNGRAKLNLDVEGEVVARLECFFEEEEVLTEEEPLVEDD